MQIMVLSESLVLQNIKGPPCCFRSFTKQWLPWLSKCVSVAVFECLLRSLIFHCKRTQCQVKFLVLFAYHVKQKETPQNQPVYETVISHFVSTFELRHSLKCKPLSFAPKLTGPVSFLTDQLIGQRPQGTWARVVQLNYT